MVNSCEEGDEYTGSRKASDEYQLKKHIYGLILKFLIKHFVPLIYLVT